MKSTLLFLFLLCTCALAAQSSEQAFVEQEANGDYFFSVKVDRNQVPDLVACYNLLTDNELSIRSRGSFGWTDDDGSALLLNTRKRMLTIENVERTPGAQAAAKRMAARVKMRLKMKKSPTPPTPPVN